MKFKSQVTMGFAPKNSPKWVTPARFEIMTDEQKYYYVAKYAKYKKVKVREYYICDECGRKEFMGWMVEERPIGKPVRYVLVQQSMPYSVYKSGMASMMESVNHSNVLAARILNR